MKILITGGAGFIGSHLAVEIARSGNDIVILDNLSPQIHGVEGGFPVSLTSLAECIKGDICDRELLKGLIADAEVVIHLAAETGTGQSMYSVEHYANTNMLGTATLLDVIVNHRPKNLQKLILASSRAVYGEGEYRCSTHGHVFPVARTAFDMEAGRFEPKCPTCGEAVAAVATSEIAPFGPASFYGLTKQTQEQMILMFAQTLGLDGFALRYQNVYGPGQSLTNPYTGILAIFSNLVRQGKGLNIFEDGQESRDFVYIEDVVRATAACAAKDAHGVMAVNVGSGIRTSVLEVARAIADHFGADVPIEVTGAFRLGDIRHNFADLSRLKSLIGFQPRWSFQNGLAQFLTWAERYPAVESGFDRSLSELEGRGLMRRSKSHH